MGITSKINGWEIRIENFNLKHNTFPSTEYIVKDIDPPYETMLIHQYFNALMQKRSDQYWGITSSMPKDLCLRMKGLHMDMAGDGY